MIALGNFLFRYRNMLFPVFYLIALLPSPPILPHATAALCLGLAVALTGQVIRAATVGLAYIKRGGRDGRVAADELVTEGLFAHCRNPLYLGNLLIALGVALALNGLWFFLLGGGFFILGYHAITRAEETFLTSQFGQAYRDYCRRTPRFAFRLAGLPATLRSMRFNWARLIVKEYGTPFAWMSLLLLGWYLRDHLYRLHSFRWSPTDTILASILGVLVLLYLLARTLKKFRILRA